MKKSVKSFENLYGEFATKDFVESLMSVSKTAKSKIRENLIKRVRFSNPTNHELMAAIKAEKFWELLHNECIRYLHIKE